MKELDMNKGLQHRSVKIIGWTAFVIGAAWVFAMTVFVNTATVGIPFAMVNGFQGHWEYLDSGHWWRGLKYPETIGIALGICLLAFESTRLWKWNSVISRGMVLVLPFLVAAMCGADKGGLLFKPWWLVYFIAFGFFFAPYFTLQMFFQKVDGEFFIDGGGLILVASWWSILCSCWWLFLFMERRGLIIPNDQNEISLRT
jgi:hypothetical protein